MKQGNCGRNPFVNQVIRYAPETVVTELSTACRNPFVNQVIRYYFLLTGKERDHETS